MYATVRKYEGVTNPSVMLQQRLYNDLRFVIPAKTGIQAENTGFRVKPGMTICKPFSETLY